MYHKKSMVVAAALAVTLCASVMTGCGKEKEPAAAVEESAAANATTLDETEDSVDETENIATQDEVPQEETSADSDDEENMGSSERNEEESTAVDELKDIAEQKLSNAVGKIKNVIDKDSIPRVAVGSFPMEDGSWWLIPLDHSVKVDNADAVVITPNCRHLVVLGKDQKLYVMETDGQNIHEAYTPEDAKNTYFHVREVGDDGFRYYSEGDKYTKYYCMSFTNYSVQEIPGGGVNSNNATAFLLTKPDERAVCIWNSEMTEPKEVFNWSNNENTIPVAISGDAEFAIWRQSSGESNSAIIYDNGKIKSVDSSSDSINGILSKDQKLGVIIDYYGGNDMIIVRRGQDPIKVELDDELSIVKNNPKASYPTVNTNKGLLSHTLADDVTDLYVLAGYESDDGNVTDAALYRVSLDGDVKSILQNIADIDVVDGGIVYRDSDHSLYAACLDGESVKDTILLATNVGDENYYVTEYGGYVYYWNAEEDTTGAMCCYHIGEIEPVVLPITENIDVTATTVDGETIYYSMDDGTLMSWTYQDDETTAIWADGILRSSGIDYAWDQGKVFMVEPDHIYYTTDHNAVMRYDGQKSTQIGKFRTQN